MAAVVLEARLAQAGLADRVEVHSSGTGDWHLGQPMDPRAAATLASHGFDPSRHRAEQFERTWLDDHDLVLVMDTSDLATVSALRVRRTTRNGYSCSPELDPEPGDLEVPDPWGGGPRDYAEVFDIVSRTVDRLVDELRASL